MAKKTTDTNDLAAGWLANALAWIRGATEARRELLQTKSEIRRTSLVHLWADGNETETAVDEPGQLLTFTDPGQFAAAVAESMADQAAAVGLSYQAPAVTVGDHVAHWLPNGPHSARVYRLVWRDHPALALLSQLEKDRNTARGWKNQTEAYDLARLQLASILPANMAETIARAAWKITSTQARQLGATADKGIREFSQESVPDGQAEPIRAAAYVLTVPIFSLATICGNDELQADIKFEITCRPASEETMYRLAPLDGQCDLARQNATAALAVRLSQFLRDACGENARPPAVWLATASHLAPNADPYRQP